MDAFAFSERAAGEPQPVYVLVGEERFLKQLALERIEALVFGEEGNDFARTAYEGDNTDWATVRDELETLPFLSPRRLVIVQDADDFVSQNRESLEGYVKQPSRVGVLVLDVETWTKTTRLAKALDEKVTIRCEPIKDSSRLAQWCGGWASKRHGKSLPGPAAQLLVELIGPEMGVLDQEIAKLATYVGDRPQIDAKDVDTLVGHSRFNTAWEMLDALAKGERQAAFNTLHRLLDQGEEPLAILGAMSWQLRLVARVARLVKQGESLQGSMSACNVPYPAKPRTEGQLRHLGPRALKLFDWLLEADLALKSTGGLSPRGVMERFVARLAGPVADDGSNETAERPRWQRAGS